MSERAGNDEPMIRVLVVDDEAPIRLLCRVNLEAEGMHVVEASDGPGGLESLCSRHGKRSPLRSTTGTGA